MSYSLHGQTALLTHASCEFTAPIALALSSRGAALAVVDPGHEHAQAVVNTVQSSGGRAQVYSVEAARQSFTHGLGAPGILVMCPPDTAYYPHDLQDVMAFDAVISTYLRSLYEWMTVCTQWSQDMPRQVVFVTGTAAYGGWHGWTASAAVFGAVHALARTLAVEWARLPIRVNVLVPGVTTAIAQRIAQFDPRATLATIRQRSPQQRLVTHDDVANALLYLLSPSASYITGEVLRVDGGWTAWGRLYAQAR